LGRLNIRFLYQQSIVLLLLIYFALVGGSLSGVWFYRLRRLSLIILSVVVAIWWILWARRGFPFPRTRLDLVWLVFVLAQGLATLRSIDPRRGVIQLTLTVLYWLAFYVAVDLLRHYVPGALVFRTFLFVGIVLVSFGVLEFARWYRGWWEMGGWEHPLPPATVRLQSLASHPNMLVAYMNVLLPFGIATWVMTKRRLARVVLAVWLAAVLATVYLTSSRGGWLGTGAGLATLAFLCALDRREQAIGLWRQLRRRPVLLAAMGFLVLGTLAAGGLLVLRQARHPTHGPLFSSRQSIWAPVWATFAQFPVWGAGPATYGTQSMQVNSIPPDTLYMHAHSFVLNTLLESGLIGVLALVGFVTVVARSVLVRWRSTPVGARAYLVAAIAALVATAVHSQFDMPQVIAGFSLLIVLVLAFVESRPVPRSHPVWVERGSRVLLGLAWPLLLAGLFAGLTRYGEYTWGVALANGEQYQAAAPFLDRAAEDDSLLASNWFQAGYVHAILGLQEGDTIYLQKAAANYRTGLELEPDFATNWAQLGALLYHLGDEQAALEALGQAAERAPQEVVFVLTLAVTEEEVGDPARAKDLYWQVLEAQPKWAESAFFRATPLRASVREVWLAEWTEPQRHLDDCWQALGGSDLEAARDCFIAAQKLNDPVPYYGLGMTELAAGNVEQAAWDLRVAVWVSERDPRTGFLASAALGDALADRGDLEEAARWYELALHQPMPAEARGGGVTTGYTWLVFGREAIFDRFLPGVVQGPVTDDEVETMLALGAVYERLGQVEDAARVYRDVLEAAPDAAPYATEAGRRLDALEAR
jgi:tetratricopeptide (TPR) repeat protein/O-antigen ligase